MIKSTNLGKTDDYVYDISLDGTVVNALGMNVAHNTDGFNFEGPKKFRYTEENPYISTGAGRNTVKGKSYVGVKADIAEFEDLYLRGKMGLGLDDICPATINFSRKNYADLLDNGEIKLVGNSIKSKASSALIQEALEKCIRFLLNNDGKSFIQTYYEYIEKIYNYRVPLQLIASKGKIKQSLEDYKKACGEFTAGGAKKSRQAWYELAIANNLKVDIGDTIYYINTGTKKGESDVKRVTHYFQERNGEKVEVTKELTRAWERYKKEYKANPDSYKEGKQLSLNEFSKSKHSNAALGVGKIWDEDEIILNCQLLPQNIMDSEEDMFCDEDFEYNVPKYMEQFNNKMKPLTVCLKPGVREKLIVTNPNNRGYFTDEECELCSGMPFNTSDQDTYEELMTMDRREVDFWIKVGIKPPYVDEIGMDWDKIVADNLALKERESNEFFKALDTQYQSILSKLKTEEKNEFYETGILPNALKDVVHLDMDMHVRFNLIPDMTPSSGGYVFDDIIIEEDDDDDGIVE